MEKAAWELVVGDVFARHVQPGIPPRSDAVYTVVACQRVPIRDFFGGLHDRVYVTAENHLLGPAKLDLGINEPVWIIDHELPRPPAPAPPGRAGGRTWRGRLGRRF
jgi:hypothetical protein